MEGYGKLVSVLAAITTACWEADRYFDQVPNHDHGQGVRHPHEDDCGDRHPHNLDYHHDHHDTV